MAIYSLFSASGSPGVTTTAVALATRWPRSVLLVDADPTGSQAIAAGFLHSAVPHERGLMELAAAVRFEQVRAVMPSTKIHFEGTNADFLQGPRSPQQARSLVALWPAILEVFTALDEQGTDVILDLGRMGMENFASSALHRSDRAVLVMRSNLPAIVGAHNRIGELSSHFSAGGGRDLKLAVVGQGQPYSAREIAKKFGVSKPIPIGFDATAAAHFNVGSAMPKRRIGSSALLRSVDAMISALRDDSTVVDEEEDDA